MARLEDLMARPREHICTRFWPKVGQPDANGCRIWLAGVATSGYGAFQHAGKGLRAHRVAWILSNGAIPEGVMVLHRCDVPLCCSVVHLFLGSASDNRLDAKMKGRIPRGDDHPARRSPAYLPRGSRHGRAKLTEADVMAIRASAAAGTSLASLGREYGVSNVCIRFVVIRRNWAHI